MAPPFDVKSFEMETYLPSFKPSVEPIKLIQFLVPEWKPLLHTLRREVSELVKSIAIDFLDIRLVKSKEAKSIIPEANNWLHLFKKTCLASQQNISV